MYTQSLPPNIHRSMTTYITIYTHTTAPPNPPNPACIYIHISYTFFYDILYLCMHRNASLTPFPSLSVSSTDSLHHNSG